MTPLRTGRRFAALLAVLAAALSGAVCQDEEQSLEARPFDPAPEPEARVALDTVAAVLPDWAGGAYSAWRIEWEGNRPARLKVERYRPGECLARARYRYAGEGDLAREALEVVAREGEAGAPVGERDLLLATLAREASTREDGLDLRTDVGGRLVWSYRREVSGREGVPDVEVMGWVTYEPESCVLPAMLRTRQVPAKQTPARAAQ